MGKGSRPRPQLISNEEKDFRWDYADGKYSDMGIEEFRKRIKEIRGKTGKP